MKSSFLFLGFDLFDIGIRQKYPSLSVHWPSLLSNSDFSPIPRFAGDVGRHWLKKGRLKKMPEIGLYV